MGRDKAFLTLDGETLASIALRKLRAVCPDVAIAGGASDLAMLARVIPDTHPGCGPLAGIVAALEQSEVDRNLFLAVDMPFVPVDVLATLLSAASSESVLLAEAEGKLQPLCGVYSRRALPVLRAELEAGRYKVKDAVVATGVFGTLPFENPAWFRNVNTPDDFKEARGLK